MNAKQIAAIKHLTNRLASLVDEMTFEIQVLNDCTGKPVMVSATNTNAAWYVKHEFVLAFVGPRGGVKVRNASPFIRNMISG